MVGIIDFYIYIYSKYKMIQCVDYKDILFSYAKVFVLDGQFGRGYIISSKDINIMKEIDLRYPPLKTWFEDGSIKLYSLVNQEYLEIPNSTPWDVVDMWRAFGAHNKFWYR